MLFCFIFVLPQIPLGPMVVRHTRSLRLKWLNFRPQDQRALTVEVQKVILSVSIYPHRVNQAPPPRHDPVA